ncbi:DUF885 family protein [Eilatimonas milleporae]|uniref:Uncharacterized protein DUF885 n=1 Tax=Eilatimonas milleporae TaxID=911205 RepID=A0A3M0CX78_9PROT|nr:DUF885 family protein [Eilatimonas milleporae]RMB12076.1 uncharacterized protein DUF885 [Eilatimonas milleporae]
MFKTGMKGVCAVFVVCWMAVAVLPAGAEAAGPPDGTGSYEDLVALFQEFREWKTPPKVNGLVDYGRRAVDRRRADLRAFQGRLGDMGVARWSRPQQVDYLAVRAQLDQHDFYLNVSRLWSRDPGFYVDRMLRVTFTDLPVSGEARETFETELAAISALTKQARQNLTEAAGDYADLAIHNLTHADGVGHGHPYRDVPPAGVIGWYEDLAGRARTAQPDLLPAITAAADAVKAFHVWLRESRAGMTAPAGVGKRAFDWYLKQVKLMPYGPDEVVALGRRELERLWAFYALEQHRNRDLPVLSLPASREEYELRIKETDEMIRAWLVEDEIISIPDYIPGDWVSMGFNVPWIERPQGPNFWEQIQYRDPSPDHLHAVIPGHRYDGWVERNSTHPIRRHISDGGRSEGWAVYLEEMGLQLGLFETRPRTRELIYIFGIFRAVRTVGDVLMQSNEMTTAEAAAYWMDWTPFLDPDVARVDAEIYLRRPPGYGLGYTVGMFQMQELLADRKHQLGDAFALKDFHDAFMAAGRLPMSLIRWEMTGLDDEIAAFWQHTPLSKAKLN